MQFPDQIEQLHDLNKQADHGFISRDEYIRAVARLTGVSEADTTQAFAREHVLNRPLIDFITTDLRPHYKIGLVSNIGRGWIQDFFDQHQLHDLFDQVVMSNEEGITKPNPLIYERAAQRLGIYPDECIMIDDVPANCDGARVAGMQAVQFTDTAQCIGFLTRLTQNHGKMT